MRRLIKEMKKLLISLLLVFMMGFVCANGLSVSQTNFQINKSEGVDYIFALTIENQEPFDFINVRSNNPILEFDSFSLASGENKTFSVRITTNTNFNGEIRIIGEYEMQVGASNKTEEVYIDYDEGFSKCNLNLIVGDTILWINQINDEIRLKNADTGETIATILAYQNYTKNLGYATEFNYYTSLIGLPFTETCNVNVMSDSGYVHNSDYDAVINFNVNLNYEPTTVTMTLFTSSYNISYNEEVEDVLQIKNVGSKTARNITLRGEWMSFSPNNFELIPGQTKNVQYYITPIIYESNQTDRNYNLSITAEGNFQRVTKDMNIYIKYANINAGQINGTIDYNFLENTFRLYCKINPDFELCKQGISGTNTTQRIVSAIFTEETIRDLLQKMIDVIRNQETMDKRNQETDYNQTLAINQLADTQEEMKNQTEMINNNIDDVVSMVLFQSVFFLFLFFLGIGFYILVNEKVKRKISSKLGLHKGEQTW